MEKIEVQVGTNGKLYLHPRTSKTIFQVEELEIDLETVLLNSAALIKNGATTISLNYNDYSITITKDAIKSASFKNLAIKIVILSAPPQLEGRKNKTFFFICLYYYTIHIITLIIKGNNYNTHPSVLL